jgi:hypothetical protein
LNSLDDVMTRANVTLDKVVSPDGAIRVDAQNPMTVHLVEVRSAAAEGILYYRGHLRSANLKGRAYFEIRCRFPDRDLVAKDLNQAVSGTMDWVTQSIPIRLERGQRADVVALDVVIEGAGTVWVDNIALGQEQVR